MKTISITILTIIMIYFLNITMLSESFAQQVQYGIRTGINDTHQENLDLSVYEIYLHTVPPIHSIADNIFGASNISFEMALGVVSDKTNSSFLFSMGPILRLINYENIFSVSTGLKPSFMTNHIFSDFDIGGAINFISHIALTISPAEQINLGYRFEHKSNAGLYEKNPGVNFHYVEILYVL
ncbi:MAG: acyloxyacyl hydrolase [Ignavibacteriae bacterium]|nr:acyloxyacyl hydrolase [Ignavibacteriota bacterium]NOG97906.1 acyloxyacyl hydrolase [Ignavibacteriota bacterium]